MALSRRVRAIWLPAVATTLLSEVSLYAVIRAGVSPWTVLLDWHVFHAHHPLQFYIPWLLALLVVGAAGAAWSRSQGGTVRQTVVVALFPAIAALGLVVVSTIGDIIVEVGGGAHSAEHTFCGTAWAFVSFVLAPGLALSLGLLAALFARRRASEDRPRLH
jgi:hypothetical protein